MLDVFHIILLVIVVFLILFFIYYMLYSKEWRSEGIRREDYASDEELPTVGNKDVLYVLPGGSRLWNGSQYIAIAQTSEDNDNECIRPSSYDQFATSPVMKVTLDVSVDVVGSIITDNGVITDVNDMGISNERFTQNDYIGTSYNYTVDEKIQPMVDNNRALVFNAPLRPNMMMFFAVEHTGEASLISAGNLNIHISAGKYLVNNNICGNATPGRHVISIIVKDATSMILREDGNIVFSIQIPSIVSTAIPIRIFGSQNVVKWRSVRILKLYDDRAIIATEEMLIARYALAGTPISS